MSSSITKLQSAFCLPKLKKPFKTKIKDHVLTFPQLKLLVQNVYKMKIEQYLMMPG